MKRKIFFLKSFLFIFTGCAAFVGSPSYHPLPENYDKSGVKAYDSGNIRAAVTLAKTACNNNSIDDCNLIASLHLRGEYFSENEDAAFRIFQTGCNLGNADACLYLSKIYEGNGGFERNEKARDKYYNKAVEIYSKNCDAEIAADCRGIGMLYGDGYIDDPDKKQETYLEKACLLKDAKACSLLGNYYLYNIGDKNKAEESYDKACSMNDGDGCVNLLDMYALRKNPDKKAAEKIIIQADKMCASGNAKVCVYLSDIYKRYTSVANTDLKKSFEYSEKSCEYNNPYGCKLLGDAYSAGLGITANRGTAGAYYDKACSLGYKNACFSRKHDNGYGI